MNKQQRQELRFEFLTQLFHIHYDELADDHLIQVKYLSDQIDVGKDKMEELQRYIKEIEQKALSPDIAFIDKYNKVFADWMQAKHAVHDMQDRVRQKYLAVRQECEAHKRRIQDLEWSLRLYRP